MLSWTVVQNVWEKNSFFAGWLILFIFNEASAILFLSVLHKRLKYFSVSHACRPDSLVSQKMKPMEGDVGLSAVTNHKIINNHLFSNFLTIKCVYYWKHRCINIYIYTIVYCPLWLGQYYWTMEDKYLDLNFLEWAKVKLEVFNMIFNTIFLLMEKMSKRKMIDR